MEALRQGFAIIGIASKALKGQRVSGDAPAWVEFADGLLVAAIDGLGHGSEAAKASERAAEVLRTCADQNVTAVVKQCHEQIRDTRGVVMSVAAFNATANTMTWVAVGNVEAYLLRGAASRKEKSFILMRGGVVGNSLPPLREETLSVRPGDILVMATDGIRSGFSQSIDPRASPQEIADTIMADFAKENDDALVIAVRWVGKNK